MCSTLFSKFSNRSSINRWVGVLFREPRGRPAPCGFPSVLGFRGRSSSNSKESDISFSLTASQNCARLLLLVIFDRRRVFCLPSIIIWKRNLAGIGTQEVYPL